MLAAFLVYAVLSTVSAQQATEPGSVAGQVLNAVTGEPLRKAQVMLRGHDRRAGSTYVVNTDPGGNFSLASVTPGEYRLSADRTGYVRGEYGATRPGAMGTSLTVKPGQAVRDLVLRLTPHAVITGRVVDEDGDPVRGAFVSALKESYPRGRRNLQPANGAATDDIGEYRIYGLPPGKYYLSANYHASAMFGGPRPGGPAGEAVPETEENYVTVYYPGALEPSGAVPLQATAGATLRGMDFRLARVRTVRISGRVIDESGQPASRRTMISLVARDSSSAVSRHFATSLDPSGRFVMRGVRPGAYTLTAERWEEKRRSTARVAINVGGAAVDNVELRLAPPLDVTGTVRLENNAEYKFSGLRVSLLARYDTTAPGFWGGAVGEAGAFTVSGAPPDLYTVSITGLAGNHYVKSIRLGGEDVLASGANLGRAAGAPLEIVVSPNGGQVDGVVLDAKQQPASGVTVVAVPEARLRGWPDLFKSVTTGAGGQFTLQGLAPGDYRLLSWENVEPGAWHDPDFLKSYEDRGESVSLKEGARETVRLKLIP